MRVLFFLLVLGVIYALCDGSVYPLAGCWEVAPSTGECIQYWGYENTQNTPTTVEAGYANFIAHEARTIHTPVEHFEAGALVRDAFATRAKCHEHLVWHLGKHTAASRFSHLSHHCANNDAAASSSSRKRSSSARTKHQSLHEHEAHSSERAANWNAPPRAPATQSECAQFAIDDNDSVMQLSSSVTLSAHVQVLEITLEVEPRQCTQPQPITVYFEWVDVGDSERTPQPFASISVACEQNHLFFGLDSHAVDSWPVFNSGTTRPVDGRVFRPRRAYSPELPLEWLAQATRHARPLLLALHARVADDVSAVVYLHGAVVRVCNEQQQQQPLVLANTHWTRPITPLHECTTYEPTHDARRCVSWFGYSNANAHTINVQQSNDAFNTFVPVPVDRHQPRHFLPGTHHYVFSVQWDCAEARTLHWMLNGSAVATRNGPACVMGCDGVLGGSRAYDVCGVCGGDGSTCAPLSERSDNTHLWCDNDNEQHVVVNFDDSPACAQFSEGLSLEQHPAALQCVNLTVQSTGSVHTLLLQSNASNAGAFGTPNVDFGGVGVGNGGGIGQAGANEQAEYLVLASAPQTAPCAGCIRLMFDREVTLYSLSLLNVDTDCSGLPSASASASHTPYPTASKTPSSTRTPTSQASQTSSISGSPPCSASATPSTEASRSPSASTSASVSASPSISVSSTSSASKSPSRTPSPSTSSSETSAPSISCSKTPTSSSSASASASPSASNAPCSDEQCQAQAPNVCLIGTCNTACEHQQQHSSHDDDDDSEEAENEAWNAYNQRPTRHNNNNDDDDEVPQCIFRPRPGVQTHRAFSDNCCMVDADCNDNDTCTDDRCPGNSHHCIFVPRSSDPACRHNNNNKDRRSHDDELPTLRFYNGNGELIHEVDLPASVDNNGVLTLTFGDTGLCRVARIELCLCGSGGAITSLEYHYPGSGAVFDHCGVCGGDGSTCSTCPTNSIVVDVAGSGDSNPITIDEIVDHPDHYRICYYHARQPFDAPDFSGLATLVSFDAYDTCSLRDTGTCDSRTDVLGGPYCDMFAGPHANLNSPRWTLQLLGTLADNCDELPTITQCPVGSGVGGYRVCGEFALSELIRCRLADGNTPALHYSEGTDHRVDYSGTVHATELAPYNCFNETACELITSHTQHDFVLHLSLGGATTVTYATSALHFDACIQGVACVPCSGSSSPGRDLRVIFFTDVDHIEQSNANDDLTTLLTSPVVLNFNMPGLLASQVSITPIGHPVVESRSVDESGSRVLTRSHGALDFRTDPSPESECIVDAYSSTRCRQAWVLQTHGANMQSFGGSIELGYTVNVNDENRSFVRVTLNFDVECDGHTDDAYEDTASPLNSALTLFHDAAMTHPYAGAHAPAHFTFIDCDTVYALLTVVLPEALVDEHTPANDLAVVIDSIELCYSASGTPLVPLSAANPQQTGCNTPNANVMHVVLYADGAVTETGEHLHFTWINATLVLFSFESRSVTTHPMTLQVDWHLQWAHSSARSVRAEHVADARFEQHVRAGPLTEPLSGYHYLLTPEQMQQTSVIHSRGRREQTRFAMAVQHAREIGLATGELGRLLRGEFAKGTTTATRSRRSAPPLFNDNMWHTNSDSQFNCDCPPGTELTVSTRPPPFWHHHCHACEEDDCGSGNSNDNTHHIVIVNTQTVKSSSRGSGGGASVLTAFLIGMCVLPLVLLLLCTQCCCCMCAAMTRDLQTRAPVRETTTTTTTTAHHHHHHHPSAAPREVHGETIRRHRQLREQHHHLAGTKVDVENVTPQHNPRLAQLNGDMLTFGKW